MKLQFLSLVVILSQTCFGQNGQTYQNSRDETHLCGPIQIADLETDLFKKWYNESYEAFDFEEDSYKWKKKLKKTQVDIYLGTWCGDSKNWVPKFVNLWDQLGLDRSQLNFIALYDGEENYKQGPKGEELGKNIHRVPTFIFKNDQQEYARIVESPSSDLITDLAQIALGYPSKPNYSAATYMMALLNAKTKDEIYTDFKTHVNAAYRLVGKRSELNTLGYVYLRSGRLDEALTVFHFNTYFFPHTPNVFDSYAETLTLTGDTEEAIKYYQKVLELDSDNKNALEQLEKLQAG